VYVLNVIILTYIQEGTVVVVIVW